MTFFVRNTEANYGSYQLCTKLVTFLLSDFFFYLNFLWLFEFFWYYKKFKSVKENLFVHGFPPELYQELLETVPIIDSFASQNDA